MPNIPFPFRGGDFNDFAQREKEIALKRKFWAVIEKNLRAVIDNNPKDQEYRIYFVGGSLCLDVKDHLYILGINGVGSVNAITLVPTSKKVYLPDFITQMVQQVYIQEKDSMGDYFRSTRKDIAWV